MGRVGQGAPKREQMSVPPVIEESWTFEGKELYTYSNEEGGNTEPVDIISRSLERVRWDSTVNIVYGRTNLVLYRLVRGNQYILQMFQMQLRLLVRLIPRGLGVLV